MTTIDLTVAAPRPEHRGMSRSSPLVALALALTSAAQAAPDAGAPAAGAARSPQAILDDYAKAVNAPAVAKHKSAHLKRQISIKGMGINGTEERWMAAGDKMLAVMTLPGLGTMKQGSTGSAQ